MITEAALLKMLEQQRILPLFYAEDTACCVAVVKALYQAGIRSVEFTNRGSQAIQNSIAIAQEIQASMPEMILAVGTIRSKTDVRDFVAAGAQVLISPFYDEEIDAEARRCGVVWIPGVMTVRELHLAQKAGRTIVKLFPGNLLTPAFVEAVKPLFREMHFLVTGGVEPHLESISSWLHVGVSAVGLGSKLITKDILAKKDTPALQHHTEHLLRMIKKINS